MSLERVSTFCAILLRGHVVVQLVEALRYKPEGHEFDSGRCNWYNPSGRTMALGPTRPLTEMSAGNNSLG